MILKKTIHIVCSNQCLNWNGNLKRALRLLKTKRRIRVQKQKKFLKSEKKHFKRHLSTESPNDENILQSIPNTTPSIKPSTEELIITKEEVRKAISLLKNNKVPGSDLITAGVLKVDENQ